MAELRRLRLKGVVQCSFARSEDTNLKLYRQTAHYPGDLQPGEAFLFLAQGGDQVVFVFSDIAVDFGGVTREVIDSRKLRLRSGTWSPFMLQNYANMVGLELVGIKRFEQVHAAWRDTKRRKAG